MNLMYKLDYLLYYYNNENNGQSRQKFWSDGEKPNDVRVDFKQRAFHFVSNLLMNWV